MAARRRQAAPGDNARGFTLVELLVAVAVIAVLLSVLLPVASRAREQARAAVCGSNIRQLVLANDGYAADHGGRYCPGAVGMLTENLHRWHGTRQHVNEPFDPCHGPLVPYLGADAGIRVCPSFRAYAKHGPATFERGCGGYGYNYRYLGRVLERKQNGSYRMTTDGHGPINTTVRRPVKTLMFADTAFAAVAGSVIEYSFAEPRFSPEYLHWRARMDPSIHFRHANRTNVAWCDGHVDCRQRTFSWKSSLYTGDPGAEQLGWFGPDDTNCVFDLD